MEQSAKMTWYILIYIFLCTGINAKLLNYTFTLDMAAKCKSHQSYQGYKYDVFYDVANTTNLHHDSHNFAFEMHIAIKASSNGHILLSGSPYPEYYDPVYEIVIGGGGNMFTELRRNLKRNARVSKRTINILSASEYRAFYIKRDKAGILEFGPEGSDTPLLQYIDIDPLKIEYFSFASWNGVEATFLYDCPSPSEIASPNVTYFNNSKKVERNLSASEQLKKDKLQFRQANLAPMPEVNVSIAAVISGVSFDAFDVKLTTRLTLFTMWEDDSLAWNPDKYKGLMNVKYRQGQIWRPRLHVFNSDTLNALKTSGHEMITLNSTGIALFYLKTTIETGCFSDFQTYNRWPRDKYKCAIVIQAWEPHEKIRLSLLKYNEHKQFNALTEDDHFVENEWELIGITNKTLHDDLWITNGNVTYSGDRLILRLSLQRKSTNYDIVFHTPLIVLMTFVLMSFWSEPLQMSRVWFYAGATVFICAGLCFIDYLIPCHTVPIILIVYIVVLSSILVALILHVMMMTSVPDKVCKIVLMKSVLSARWFRALFCLPIVKISSIYNRVNDGYSQHEDENDDPFVSNGVIEEMRSESTPYTEKEVLAKALDKLSFIVYSILFAAMLAVHNYS